jgi:short-subunit dehydrogenase
VNRVTHRGDAEVARCGKTALVTGASAGLGSLFARLFARDGHEAYVLSFTEALAHELRGSGTVTVLCPDPTATEFAHVAGAESTQLFHDVADAAAVARYGYRANPPNKPAQGTAHPRQAAE